MVIRRRKERDVEIPNGYQKAVKKGTLKIPNGYQKAVK